MDLTSGNMYDTFKDEIWRELGPLDPNWFEVLTAQACLDDGSVSDQDELCANQEGQFKAASDKTEVDSQLFSTPKVFSRHRIVSSPAEDEPSFGAEPEKGTLPWAATQSPHIFPISKQGVVDMMKYGGIQPHSQMSFDLLRTPQRSPSSYARHISESLGAQINPDISWTSSLNTPPAVPSTLILSKNQRTSPCPASISAEKDVVFVRKLFPSLSNPSSAQMKAPQNSETSAVQQDVVPPEVRSAHPPSQSDGVWRQKLPDAVEDGGIGSTAAASNLSAGAESGLSFFFASSSSALRKVKHDRIRPKQTFENKQIPSSAGAPTVNDLEPGRDRRDDREAQGVSSEAAAADPPLSQWSPLSLSQIPSSVQQSRSDCDGVVRPPAAVPASGGTKKTRRFVYTIAASKPQVESKGSRSAMLDSGRHSHVKEWSETSGSSSEKTLQQQSRVAPEGLPPPVQAKDLDMSQLCKEFAQDFSPTSDSGHTDKVPEDTDCHFSPSACLSAVRQAKQRKRGEILPLNFDDVTNRKTFSLISDVLSANEDVGVDSGFQSALADVTHLPSSVLPSCSGNPHPNLLCSKGEIHGASTFTSTKKEEEKVNIDAAAEARVCRTLTSHPPEKLTQDPQKKSDGQNVTASRRPPNSGTVNNNHYNLVREKLCSSQHEETTTPPPSLHTSPFKTASKGGVRVSSASLERAKLLLQNPESGNTLNHQPDRSNSGTEKSEFILSNQSASVEGLMDSSCQLTDSQKADVTELCTLLEEAESQFEFTQFRSGEMNSLGHVAPPPKTEKDVEVDLLTGIDFDDSFPSDVDRQVVPAGTPDITTKTSETKCGASDNPRESQSVSDTWKNIHFYDQAGPSVHVSEVRSSDISTEPLNLHDVKNTGMRKLENKDPSMFGETFNSASGNILTVTKAHLSKARALFTHLEELHDGRCEDTKVMGNVSAGLLRHQKPPPHSEETPCNKTQASQKQRSDLGAPPCAPSEHTGSSAVSGLSEADGFCTASGKKVTVSSESVKRAECMLNGLCTLEDININGQEESRRKAGQTTAEKRGSVSRAALKTTKKLECREVEERFSEKPPPSLMSVRGAPPGKSGFVSASGKPVELSSAALLKARALFSDIDVSPHSDTKRNDNQQGRGEKSQQIYPDLKPPVEGNVRGPQGRPFSTKLAASSKLCMDSQNRTPVNPGVNKACLDGAGHQNKTPSGLKSDQTATTNFPKEPGNGCIKSINEQVKLKAKPFPRHSGSFQTASGRTIPVSSDALKKATALLSDCGEVDEVRPSHPALVVPAPSSRNGGFVAASGKQVSVSSEALRRAGALFSDISLDFNIPAASDKNKSDKEGSGKTEAGHFSLTTTGSEKVHVSEKKLLEEPESASTDTIIKHPDTEGGQGVNSEENGECVSETEERNLSKAKPEESGGASTEDMDPGGGFQTASGKDVSSEALRKAKSLFGEDGVGIMRPRPLSSCPVTESSTRHFGLVSARGKQVSVSSEALQRARALLSENIQTVSDAETSECCGFRTARGQKVHVSQRSLLKAKHLLKECEDSVSVKVTEEADCSTEDGGENVLNERQEDRRPSVASRGEKDQLSECKPGHGTEGDPGNGCTEHNNKQVKQQANALPTPSDGFHTALWKGTTVLSKCDDDDDDDEAAPYFKVPGPSSGTCGFQAASGRKVWVSSEAFQRARALFSDITFKADFTSGSVSDVRKNKHSADGGNPEVFSGFTTAGGAKVHVSQKNLLKAKCVFEDLDSSVIDQQEPLNSGELDRRTTGGKNTRECEGLEDKLLTSAPPRSGGRLMEAEENTDTMSRRDNRTPGGAVTLRLCSGQRKTEVLSCEVNQSGHTRDSSPLGFQSLHLTGCSETQQDFVAQEAIDCTKALLQDEGFAGQSFSTTSDFTSFPQSPNSSKRSSNRSDGGEKRSLARDDLADDVAPPPLKRRLIEEFDQTVDGLRSSTLQPMKSCPNVLNDRGVSLHPNISRPHRQAAGPASNPRRSPLRLHVSVEQKLHSTSQTSTSGDKRSAGSKVPAFVPPFIRNPPNDRRGNMAVTMRAPSFVPPFNKQRAQVDQKSERHQEDQDEGRRSSVRSSGSGSFVPPARRTDRSKDVGIPTDATTDNDDLEVTCGSAHCHTQSGVHDSLSTGEDSCLTFDRTELARDMQDMRIRKKKRQTVRPQPGILFLRKTSGVPRIPLKAAVSGNAPGRFSPEELYGHGVHRHVCEITSETAEGFRFNLLQFVRREALVEGGGVRLGDGGWLIPGGDGTAGKEEFYRALCDTPGVDPKLLSEAWLFNHYRWVVWKQASMEKSFPETMGSLCLTPEQVLLQLKYRYDVEVDRSRRPALRKILEKDDTSAKTLVLCLSEVVSSSRPPTTSSDAQTPQGGHTKVRAPPAVVRLTDGWYSVKAQLDEPLTAMLRKGRLAVGGKLMVSGARLLGAQDACPPLEAPESVVLKIDANSCRPASWALRLGFYKDPRPFRVPVSSLFHNGGPVGCVDIVVLRSYPTQWMERKADGGVVFRCVRAEEKEARRHSSVTQRSMEALFSKIQDEFEREEKEKVKAGRGRARSYQDVGALREGEELYEALGDDPADLEAHLNERQLEALHAYRRSVVEKKQRELQDRCRRALEADDADATCPKRDVTPVWRLCVSDSLDQTNKVYQLNVWRPSSDLQALLKEGGRFRIYNLTTSEGKKRSGIESLQLTVTKKTQFQDLQVSSDWLSARFQPRVTTSFVNLQNPDYRPPCGEVDVTGYVVRVTDRQGSCPALYLVDGELNFVKVRCFSSFSHCGIEDVVKPAVLLAVSNLQLRGQSAGPTPVVYAGDLTAFSTNPKEGHLRESLAKMKTHAQCGDDFLQAAEEKLSLLTRSGPGSCLPAQQPALTSHTPSRVVSHKAVRNLGSFTPSSRNPPAAASSSDKDPRLLKRKRALDYLSHMPSPPPLSALTSLASPGVNKTFNPPRRSGTPSTLKSPQSSAPKVTESLQGKEWVKDEELVMIDTQTLHLQ